MASFNKVMLMGNLTRDVELRYTPNGNQAVANFGIACNRKFKTQSGEEREEVTFVDCEAWGRTGEVMKEYLSKGRPVFVEGRPSSTSGKSRKARSSRSCAWWSRTSSSSTPRAAVAAANAPRAAAATRRASRLTRKSPRPTSPSEPFGACGWRTQPCRSTAGPRFRREQPASGPLQGP